MPSHASNGKTNARHLHQPTSLARSVAKGAREVDIAVRRLASAGYNANFAHNIPFSSEKFAPVDYRSTGDASTSKAIEKMPETSLGAMVLFGRINITSRLCIKN